MMHTINIYDDQTGEICETYGPYSDIEMATEVFEELCEAYQDEPVSLEIVSY